MTSLCTIIPVYNDLICLQGTLFRHLSQSRVSDRIAIVDDGSTDDTSAFLRQFNEILGGHPNVFIYRNPISVGVIEVANRQVENSAEDWIWFLGCDDYPLRLDFVDQALRMAEAFPNVGLITADPLFLMEGSGEITRSPVEISDDWGFLSPKYLIERQKRGPIQLPGHTSLIRRDVWNELGGFHPEFKHHADWFLGWAAAYRHGVGYLKGGWVVCRVRDRSHSHDGRRDSESQKAIREAMLATLKQDESLSDVRPFFLQSGCIEEHVR